MLVLTTQNNFIKDYPDQYDRLVSCGFEVKEIRHEQLADYISEADALMVGTEAVQRDVISKSKQLKIISRYGIGYDAIDLHAANEKGIIVANAPGCNSNAVAELTLLSMIYCSRNIHLMNENLRLGRKVRPLGTELSNRKVGIIGVGTIGSIVARRCKAFDMDVYCNDIVDKNDFCKKNDLHEASKEEIYRNCDIITVHTPKTKLTDNLISKEEIAMMKDGVILINMARGGIINEKDLYDALVNKKVKAAALDVSVVEPAVNNPLVQLDNCLFTPHAGASTYEAYKVMQSMAVDNVIEVLTKGTCKNKVN